MKKLHLIILVLLLCSSSFISQNVRETKAESKTIVVPDDYSTITDAVNHASDGDVVFVKNGIYNESLVIDKSISLVGEDVKNTIIEGTHAKPVIIVNHDGVTI